MSFAKSKVSADGEFDRTAKPIGKLAQGEAALGPGASLPLPLEPGLIPEEGTASDRQKNLELEKELEKIADDNHETQSDWKNLSSVEKNESAIRVLIMRLSDLLFLPSDNIAPQERSLADDLISRLFEKADHASKFKLLERLLHHSEPPPSLIRVMLHSENEIALPLLRSQLRLKQADLISVVTTSGTLYQKSIAERVGLPSAVCDAIIQCADIPTIRVMLRNHSTIISRTGFVRLAEKSMKHLEVLEPLIERIDFPIDLAHLVFWWSPSVLRQKIIQRFASPRQTIFEVISSEITEDFHEMYPEVANAFQMVRKAKKMDRQFIDKALDELESGDACNALDILASGAYLRAETIAQIFDDNGGEAIGVYCKATGFGRERFTRLRSVLKVRRGDPWDKNKAANDPVLLVYDTLSTDKADLILRYWDRATREIEI